MEALGSIISIVMLIIHLISKYGGSSESSSNYSNSSYVESEIVLSKKEKLELIYDKDLTKCFQSSIVTNFNFNVIESFFSGKYFNFFKVDEVIKVKNCAYFIVLFQEQYTSIDSYNNKIQSTRLKTAYLSVNNVFANNNLIIYGLNHLDQETNLMIQNISKELMNEMSK